MTAPLKPQKVQSNGNDSWWFVPAVADIKIPKITEVNAAGGLNVSCYLLADREDLTTETERVTLARLLCETSTTEGLGEQKWSLSDLMFAMDPQGAASSDSKKAWALFKDGATGFLVRRQGVKADTDTPEVTVGQFVDVFQVVVGKATPGRNETGSSGIYVGTAPVALTATPAFNVATVA